MSSLAASSSPCRPAPARRLQDTWLSSPAAPVCLEPRCGEEDGNGGFWGQACTLLAAGVVLLLDACFQSKLRSRWAGVPASPPGARCERHGVSGPVPVRRETVISDVPFVPGNWERWPELAVAACVLSMVRRAPGDQTWLAPTVPALLRSAGCTQGGLSGCPALLPVTLQPPPA